MESENWIGEPLVGRQVATALALGTIGVTIAGVQPVLFGSLLEAGRITIAQVGHAATVELLALGIGVVLGGAICEGRTVRRPALGACLLLVLANLATLAAGGEGVTLVRFVAGLAGGALVWIATAAIVRAPRPAVLSAAFLLVQAVVQCLVAAGIAVIAPGAPGGVPLAIAGLSVLGCLLVPLLPRSFSELPREPTASGLPPLRGWAVLAAVLLLQAAIVGAWVYMEPLGRQVGMSPTQIAFATPAANAAQIGGGVAAILLVSRLPWFAALGTACAALVAVLLGLAQLPSPNWFLGLEMAFGALWTFSSPCLTPFSIDNDPTRRTAEYGSSAMLIGSGLGPLLASLLASDSHPGLVLQLCAGLAMATMVLILVLFLTRHRLATSAGLVPGKG